MGEQEILQSFTNFESLQNKVNKNEQTKSIFNLEAIH